MQDGVKCAGINVVVDGRVVVRDGRPTLVDEAAIRRAGATAAGALWARARAEQPIDWQWAADLPGHGRSAGLDTPEGRIVLDRSPGAGAAELRLVDAAGQTVWRQVLGPGGADSVALVVHDGMLYAALYSDLATGGEVVALDARRGTRRWATSLIALGPLHHSKYRTALQLRWVHGRLVVFGDESAGRYIEVLDPSSGRRLSHRRV